MKRIALLNGIVILLICCFAINTFNASYTGLTTPYATEDVTSGHPSLYLTAVNTLFVISPFESTVRVVNQLPLSLRMFFEQFSCIFKIIENFFYSVFSQYIFCFHKEDISLYRSSIVFPFQYFW